MGGVLTDASDCRMQAIYAAPIITNHAITYANYDFTERSSFQSPPSFPIQTASVHLVIS